jgi:tetratricopeptide (TPR) repeat protein
MARSLSPDAAVAALHSAIEHYGREGGLKRVRAVVDQLPDVPAKGLILRRLGEACHALRMRTSAMRLLSQALDMEGQKLPASWHEQREQLYNALAEKALELEDETVALAIAQRITHSERRGTLETQVVRWLLAHNQIERAREVALHIDHESLSAWAQAEVAVTLARTGQIDAAEEILTAIPSDTAWAWAQTALACIVAPTDEEAARRRIDQIESPAQHDRALAQLAHALVEADKDGDALDAAARIGDVAVRVAALLDLRLTLEGLVAMLALEQATAVIGKVERDMRVPLLSMLAASYAALGRSEQALHVANMAEGEEHERALSRVAVALAQRGDYAQALDIARNLADADEREWTLDELTRALAAGGHWQQAEALTAEIGTTHQRARTLADLAIARARAGEPLAGLQLAHRIVLVGTEYARAVTFIAPLLVAAGQSDIALVVVEDQYLTSICIPAHTLSSAQVSRYLATVAIALAEHGDLDRATSAIMQRVQPLDQARAHVAIAQTAAPYDPDRAHAELGYALRAMLLGRDEAYRLLVQATPTFASLGGAALLNDIAAAIDEVDTW